MIEMLRLSSDDRLNQHQWLGSLLCRLERYADALYFVQVYSLSYMGSGNFKMPARGGTVFQVPLRRVCNPDEEKALERVTCWLTYPAALSAFKLWGDCAESRQYLRIAVKGNRHVITKILARIKQPGKTQVLHTISVSTHLLAKRT